MRNTENSTTALISVIHEESKVENYGDGVVGLYGFGQRGGVIAAFMGIPYGTKMCITLQRDPKKPYYDGAQA